MASSTLAEAQGSFATPKSGAKNGPPLIELIVRGLLVGVGLAALLHVVWLWKTHNLHAVIPGRVYRSSQLTADDFEHAIRAYGIRTVINLRGCGDPNPWYLEECRKSHELQVQQADICLSAGRLPSTVELRRLLHTLDETEYPILLHCFRGADRTGMASALVLLLQTDVGFREARRQLGWRYGHFRLGRTAYLDQFLDSYMDWLRAKKLRHSPATIRAWIEHEYAPPDCRCDLTPVQLPDHVPLGQPSGIVIRCRNTGTKNWKFRPGTNAGFHLHWQLWGPAGDFLGEDQSGMLEAIVSPDEKIDLTIALPSLHQNGRHHLFIDLADEQHCYFHQTGSEPLELDIEAR
jgi:protein tyrosine phosphatase (PTP) superfamily phosphohydrolase (DUF442 family)